MELHEMVCFGNVSRVKNILKRIDDKAIIDTRNSQGNAPLHMVYHGTTENVQDCNNRLTIMGLLVQKGANVNARGRWNETPLHVAARKQQIGAVKLLLENNADPNLRDDDGRSSLHSVLLAESLGHEDKVIELLLRHGAFINITDVANKTPLIYAAKLNRLDLVQVLVEAGARVNLQPDTKCGYTSLFYACRNQNPRMIDYLLKNGADVALKERRMRMTVLHGLASSWRDIYRRRTITDDDNYKSINTELSAKLLLDHDVEVDARDSEDMTALHLAAHNEDEKLIRVLLSHGADVNASDSYGDTPLHQLLDKEVEFDYRAGYPRLERIVKIFVEYGANALAKNGKGQSPFYLAVRRLGTCDCSYSMRIINFMLSVVTKIDESTFADENLSLKRFCNDINERIPSNVLNVSIVLGYERVVDTLIEIGYDLDPSFNEDNEKTPLYYAVKMQRYELTKLLLEAGCRVDSDGCVNYGSTPLHVALFDVKDIKIACLLLEYKANLYNKDEFGKNVLDYTIELDEITSNDLVNLIIYRFAMDLRSMNQNLMFTYLNSIESNARLSKIFYICRNKLDDLKKIKICDEITVFNILDNNIQSLVKYLGNKENRDAVTSLDLMNKLELESWEFLLKVRIDLALERRKIFDSAREHLNIAFVNVLRSINYESLPDKILWNILGRLKIRELKKFLDN